MFKQSLAAAAAAIALAAPAAEAHVTLQPSKAPAGGFARLDVRVPNERDNASTRKVEVQFPPGFIFASTEPVDGWRIELKKRKLAKPVEVFGEERTEEVDTITFTAEEGAEIGPGEFRDFGLSLGLPDKAGTTLTFKALQTYTGGEVVRWIGEPDADEPAPTVELEKAEGGHGAKGGGDDTATNQPASLPAAGDDDGDGAPMGLVIAALVAGLLGLGTGVAGLAAARRARA